MSTYPSVPSDSNNSAAPIMATASATDSRRNTSRPTLHTARVALALASLLTFVQAGTEFLTAEKQFDESLQREIERMGGGVTFNKFKVERAREHFVRATKFYALIVAGVGVVLAISTLLVYRFPIFSTTVGLILFLVVAIFIAYSTMGRHDIAMMFQDNWKILGWELLIVVCLVMGVQAAWMHQRQREARTKELMAKLDARPVA